MKLGTQTGSVTNHIYSRAVIGQPEPKVGMGATILCWTDRHAATVVEVSHVSKHPVVWVREDNYRVVSGSGHDGSAQYEFTPNPAGRLSTFRLRNNRWEEIRMGDKGRWIMTKGNGLRIGDRDKYHDPSF